MRLIKLIVLLMTLSLVEISAQETRLDTCITLCDDCVIYSAKQDINCIKCLMQTTLKDSLISQYKSNELVADTIINYLQFANEELTTEIEDNKVELKKRRKNVFKGTLFGFVSGSILTVLVIIFI